MLRTFFELYVFGVRAKKCPCKKEYAWVVLLLERVMRIELTYPVWKTDVLAVELHPQLIEPL